MTALTGNFGENALHARGFTLVEMAITLVIFSILVSLAVPAYSNIIRETRMKTQISDFHRSLLLARNEAIKRGARVTLCSSQGGEQCNGANWSSGWMVFTDLDRDLVLDAEEELLQLHEGLAGGNTLTGNRPVASYVSYVANGRTRSIGGGLQMGTLVLCDSRGFDHGRAIVINAAGRPSVRAADRSSFGNCTQP